MNRIQWTPKLVSKFWDGVAQTELDNLSFGKVAGPQFIEFISRYLVPGGSHLDFGAGSGHVVQILLDRELNVAAFDPSRDRQSLLLKKIGDHNHFLGVKGPDSNDQFDVVLLMEVVEHVLDADLPSVIERVTRFVRPGGYLVVSTPNNENLESASVYCPVADLLFHPWQHVRSFTPRQLVDTFKSIGFTTDFLALVDFSFDAEIIESNKKRLIIENSKSLSIKELQGSVEKSIREFRLQLKELDRIDKVLGREQALSIWQCIKLRFNVLWRHRWIIGNMQSLAHDLAYRFEVVSGGVVERLRETIAIDAAVDTELLCTDDDFDLRIGKETTIVYVGKKSDS